MLLLPPRERAEGRWSRAALSGTEQGADQNFQRKWGLSLGREKSSSESLVLNIN